MSTLLDFLAAALVVAAWWLAVSIVAATAYSLVRTHEKRRSAR